MIREFRDFALELKECARTISTALLNEHAVVLEVATKADQSFVTSLDIELERVLSARILQRYSTHGIIGEE